MSPSLAGLHCVHMCVCLLVCISNEHIEYLMKIEYPHTAESESEGLLSDCSVSISRRLGMKMTQVEAHMATYLYLSTTYQDRQIRQGCSQVVKIDLYTVV